LLSVEALLAAILEKREPGPFSIAQQNSKKQKETV
jgi:hypothetical protein